MTVRQFKEQVAALPADLNDHEVVLRAGTLIGGEVVVTAVADWLETEFLPLRPDSRRLFVSATNPSEATATVPVLLLNAR